MSGFVWVSHISESDMAETDELNDVSQARVRFRVSVRVSVRVRVRVGVSVGVGVRVRVSAPPRWPRGDRPATAAQRSRRRRPRRAT